MADTASIFTPPPRRRNLLTMRLEVPESVKLWWAYRMSDEGRKKKTVRTLGVGGAVLVLLLGGAAWWAWGPRFQPDYDSADIDDLMDYTLLSDEFNRLPVEERMRLLKKLVDRLKGMNGQESLLLAGFAAGIEGEARKQLEENGARLMVDVWDKYAKDYSGVPEGEREQYLEQAFVDFSKMMETIGGEPRDISDADRINEARKQAAEERERMREPGRQPPPQAFGFMFGVMNNNVGSYATPQQRVRGQQMMRDMARHFRGQDIATGKPLDGAAPGASPAGVPGGQPPAGPG